MRLLLLTALLALLTACKTKDDRSALDIVLERGLLIVGTEPEFPPFESRAPDGTYIGFDMDLVRELAKDLGVKIRIDGMEFASLPAALDGGKIDLIASGMTAKPERAKHRDFTDPYFLTVLCLLVNTKSGIEKPADVNGKRLAVKLGTTGDINALKLFPDAKVTRLETEGACANEVVTDRADAFLYDRHSIIRHQKANPETTRVLLDPLSREPYAMAVRLGDRKFVERLNAFLAAFRADGRYAKLHEKHFGYPPDGPREEPSTLDIVLERGLLIVGTEPEYPPFESRAPDGSFIGFDMDLVRELAKDLGVKIRIDGMEFASLPAALDGGKIDLIASGMTATKERAKHRDFTDPYIHIILCLLVNAKSGIEKPADVNGKRLAVQLGTTGDVNALKLFPDAKVTRLETEGTCANEVVADRADAFLYDRHSIIRHQKANPETTRVLLDPLSREPYAMAVRLGDRKFVERLNAFLKAIRADGRYAKLHEKHFGYPPDGPR